MDVISTSLSVLIFSIIPVSRMISFAIHILDKIESHSSLKSTIIGLAVGMAAMAMLVAALVIIMRRWRSQAQNSCKEEIGIDNPTIPKESIE